MEGSLLGADPEPGARRSMIPGEYCIPSVFCPTFYSPLSSRFRDLGCWQGEHQSPDGHF